MTPARFTGLWRRTSVAVGDAEPAEHASVHWLQVGDRFVDLRRPSDEAAPLSGPGAFGGTTTWRAPVLTWRHELDSRPGTSADAGRITWDGDDRLVERGSFVGDGGTVTYVEVWERVTPAGAGGGRAWSTGPGSLAVELAGHRMAMSVDGTGRWAGGRASAREGGWTIAEEAGDPALLLELRAVLGDPR